jgi:hypothetical protein
MLHRVQPLLHCAWLDPHHQRGPSCQLLGHRHLPGGVGAARQRPGWLLLLAAARMTSHDHLPDEKPSQLISRDFSSTVLCDTLVLGCHRA